MADYYQRAWLTISATTVTEGGGLFRELSTKDLPRVTRLPYRDRNTEKKGFFYLQRMRDGVITDEYHQQIDQCDLLGRGWVFQEWMLSPRLLSFSKSGIFFQCWGGAPRFGNGDKVRNSSENKSIKRSLRNDLSTIHNLVSTWARVVERYSGLSFTQLEGDRLMALSGVASEYGRAFHAREQEQVIELEESRSRRRFSYECGVWFPYIKHLMWEQSNPGPRSRVSGIPTWSWASMATYTEASDGSRVHSGMAVR